MYKMRPNVRAAKYIALLLSVIVPLPAMALCEAFWQPRILARAASASIELRDNRRAVATVPTRAAR